MTEINFDIYQTTGADAKDITTANSPLKIDAGFVVSATLGGDSVASLDDDVTLDIFGIVVSDANFSGHGVNFSKNSGNITNEQGAVITGLLEFLSTAPLRIAIILETFSA
jgi:hypothetical protein